MNKAKNITVTMIMIMIHIHFLAIILFADDICLLMPTCSAHIYRNNLGLTFNSKKSKMLVFSKLKVDLSTIRPFVLETASLIMSPQYVTSVLLSLAIAASATRLLTTYEPSIVLQTLF